MDAQRVDADTLLREAGWFPGRAVNIARDVSRLKADGFLVTSAAQVFLREFTRLKISCGTKTQPIVIDGALAARGVYPYWCERYSEAVGSALVPVGEYSRMTIYVDEQGGLWGGYDAVYGDEGTLTDLVTSIFFGPLRPFDRHLD